MPSLMFTEEERSDPILKKSVRKADKAAVKADKAHAKIPKCKAIKTVIDKDSGKITTKLVFEDRKKPSSKLSHGVQDTPINTALGKIHKEIRESEHDNVGVESAHKSEETAETGARLVQESCRNRKFKQYRNSAKAEQKLEKADVNALYKKFQRDNPQLSSSPFSRWQQKHTIKKEYAAAKRAAQNGEKTVKGASNIGKATKAVTKKVNQAVSFVSRHRKGVFIVGVVFFIVCFMLNMVSSFLILGQGVSSFLSNTTYLSDDSDMLAAEADYASKESQLQSFLNDIENIFDNFDKYRYDLDDIGHDPHELAAYLSAVLQVYTKESAQDEIERVFTAQYQLTLEADTESGQRILCIELESRSISDVVEELLTSEQLEIYHMYRQTLGNKPLLFSDSES